MPKLGVNIDHVATLRQARRESSPDPIAAARICEAAGCHSIVAHLREDRRHIQDRDVWQLRKTVKTRFNLEMSLAPSVVKVALALKPVQVTIVPERREEITTEGGLDVVKYATKLKRVLPAFKAKNITVSLFIAPQERQIIACKNLGISMIELHTGHYATAKTAIARQHQLKALVKATHLAQQQGIIVNAGHGLDYDNTSAVANIPDVEELNIGHSIISRALVTGLEQAVRDMLAII